MIRSQITKFTKILSRENLELYGKQLGGYFLINREYTNFSSPLLEELDEWIDVLGS